MTKSFFYVLHEPVCKIVVKQICLQREFEENKQMGSSLFLKLLRQNTILLSDILLT